VVAKGGGAGAAYGAGGVGGSGGGAATVIGGASAGTPGQGYGGGSSVEAAAGGGGGAGGAGGNATSSSSGNGGAGLNSNFSGATLNYAAGGGGGARPDEDPEGQSAGGGAAGGASVGVANRGGGGMGAGACACAGSTVWPATAGTSGIVMVRYPVGAFSATGGTVTTSGGYVLHTFTSGGTFTIGTANGAPAAVADTATTTWISPVSILPLQNDSDPNGDAITVESITAPATGSAVLQAGGTTVAYTPKPGFTGTDTFAYTVKDARGAYASATITVTVTAPANTSPSAVNDNVTVGTGGFTTFDPRGNDTDPERDALTISALGAPAHGVAQLVAGSGAVRYLPSAGHLGSDSFTYTVTDGRGGSATATVAVTVQAVARTFAISPAVAGKSTWNLDVDGSLVLSTPGTWTLTPDVDLVVPAKLWGAPGGGSEGGGGGFAGGLVQLQKGVAYRVDVGAQGATGSGGAALGGAPGGGASSPGGSFSGGGGFSGIRRGLTDALAIAGGGGGDGGSATRRGGAGGGEAGEAGLTLGGAGGRGGSLTASAGPFQGGAAVYGGGGGGGYFGGFGGLGGAANPYGGGGGAGYLNAADVLNGALVTGSGATPAAASDPDRGTGGANGGPGRIVFQGFAVANRAPVAAADVLTVGAAPTALNLRANDSDPDGDALRIIHVTPPAHGAAGVAADGSTATYTPDAGYVGGDAFQYTIADGRGGAATAAVLLSVNGGDAVPQAANDAYDVIRNIPATFDPRANDLDNGPLTIIAATTPAHGVAVVAGNGASVTYTPETGYTGADSFSYTVRDTFGNTASATVALTVLAPSAAWNPADKNAAITLGNGNLTAARTGQASGNYGTVRATGAGRTSGKYYFEVRNDVGGAQQMVGVSAAGDNLNTTLNAAGNTGHMFYFADGAVYGPGGGGTGVVLGAVAAGATVKVAVDLDAKKIWFRVGGGAWNGSATASPATNVGGVTLNPANYLPGWSAGGWGANTEQATANFGGSAFASALPRGFAPWDLSALQEPNHAPVAANDSAQTQVDVAKVVAALANDSDSDLDPLTISGTTSPAHGAVAVTGGGASVTYTPASGYIGSDSFTYTVSDGAGGSATATVNVLVTPEPVTWSATDKHASISVSGGNLTAQAVAGGWKSARATKSRSSGKYYFEATLGSGDLGVGLANATASLGNYTGADGNGVFLYAHPSIGGGVFIGGGGVGAWTSGTIAGGDVIQVVVDLDAKKLWAKRTSDANWNASASANPVTGVGGHDISGPATGGALFPSVSIQSTGTPVTANFGASAYAGTRPQGYLAWDGS